MLNDMVYQNEFQKNFRVKILKPKNLENSFKVSPYKILINFKVRKY